MLDEMRSGVLSFEIPSNSTLLYSAFIFLGIPSTFVVMRFNPGGGILRFGRAIHNSVPAFEAKVTMARVRNYSLSK